MKEEKLEQAITQIIQATGDDPNRDGLLKTPKRAAKAIKFLTSGNQASLAEIVGDALFPEPSGEIVFIRDIEFYSLCEHHLLPFFGKAHVAYRPNGHVIGLSKIPRIIDALARKLQVQERLTHEIAHGLQEILATEDIAVITEASHMCMMMRGVQKQASTTITKTTLGAFKTDPQSQAELMGLMSLK